MWNKHILVKKRNEPMKEREQAIVESIRDLASANRIKSLLILYFIAVAILLWFVSNSFWYVVLSIPVILIMLSRTYHRWRFHDDLEKAVNEAEELYNMIEKDEAEERKKQSACPPIV